MCDDLDDSIKKASYDDYRRNPKKWQATIKRQDKPDKPSGELKEALQRHYGNTGAKRG